MRLFLDRFSNLSLVVALPCHLYILGDQFMFRKLAVTTHCHMVQVQECFKSKAAWIDTPRGLVLMLAPPPTAEIQAQSPNGELIRVPTAYNGQRI